MPFGTRGDEAPIGQDHISLDEVVDGEPVLVRQVSDATAQGKPGNASRRDDAERHGQAECVRRVIDVAGGAAALDANDAPFRIDVNTLHRGQVDDEPVIAAAQPGAVVAAAADGQQQALVSREIYRRNHVGDVRASRNQQRPLVDHAVVELSRFVIRGITGPDHGPAKAVSERLDGCVAYHGCLGNKGGLTCAPFNDLTLRPWFPLVHAAPSTLLPARPDAG